MSNKTECRFGFTLMSLMFKVRDFIQPRKNILKEVGIKEGHYVLDFGCGQGSYIIPLREIVSASGRIYALDISPIAIQMVNKIIDRYKLSNVVTICSDCHTYLTNSSVDAVLLYDILHGLRKNDDILKELHRLLKPDGILSIRDHHLTANEITTNVSNKGFFKLKNKGKKTLTFVKI